MNIPRLSSLLLLAAALALPGHAEESTTTAAFSNPDKPGTLKVHLFHGDLVIHGADVKEITVKSDSTAALPTPRKDGMRVLSATAGYVLAEKDNVVTLDYGTDDGWSGGSSDFDITVPRNTNLIISNSTSGEFTCHDIAGDIDVRRLGGDVRLDGISGGALVETLSGDVSVSVKSLAAGRPLSFTSMHGEIKLRLPADAKANIRFRTHRGVILTNFDDKALVTKTEVAHVRHEHGDVVAPASPAAPAAPAAPGAPAAPAPASPDSNTIYHSHSDNDNDSSDNDWHAEVRESVREAAREAADAAREAADAVREGLQEAHIEMSGAMPPLPPMTGGKVISGTLNGGGVEIQAATLNGDITLKKNE
jgi:hypothetical protein